MTVRHRQRKGARGSSFLYARERAFSKHPAFHAETARRFPAHSQITLHTPPAFPASFPPAQPAARPVWGKKGGFLRPQRPPAPPFTRPNAPFFPGAARFLPGARPDEAPACPGFARDPGARAHPRDPRNPRANGFFCPPAPTSARRAPPECPKVALPAAETAPPCAASPPVAATRRRRSARRPRRGTALGLGNPTAVVGFSTSP